MQIDWLKIPAIFFIAGILAFYAGIRYAFCAAFRQSVGNLYNGYMTKRKIGIMGAMPEEVNDVIALLANPEKTTLGMRDYFSGAINGTEAVVAFSRWGKVAAATTASALIQRFGVTEIVFTGVAGGIGRGVKIGDVVLGKRFIQHDMDARPLMPRYEIPLLGKTFIDAGEKESGAAQKAIEKLLEDKNLHKVIAREILEEFKITSPVLHIGDIASGDKFFSEDKEKEALQKDLPSVLCVEMEGAAVAQICHEYGVPFTVIRTISDGADGGAAADFPKFIKNIAGVYSAEIIKNLL
jgi:adenosylhomocysteine nucleosidase